MKKIFMAVMFALVSITAFAEASFDEIQSLINSKQYAAAASGLEGIIQNHPKSAKAFYAMAEAQAGLGNLEKANKALNIAKGIDPTLKFVSEGSVRSLEQAITPQTAKITYEEPSHFWRNFFLLLFVVAIGFIIHRLLTRKYDTGEDDGGSIYGYGEPPKGPSPITPSSPKATPVVRPAYKGTTQTRATETPVHSTPAPASSPTPVYHSQPAPTTTVINNSSNDGLLTGMIIGNMMSNSHHHDHTTVIEREVVREKPSRDSSWDDTPGRSSSSSSSSRSSSWDDDSSSSKSSSWGSSSSSRSSSWDDSSSSSSSSWDSSSSSSSDSSSSSSDW